MSKSNQSAAIGARWIVLLVTLILAISTIVGPTASGEGNGGNIPPNGTGEDTLGTPPPSVQPNDFGFFEMLGLYFEVIF